jgi:hypothetical protein
MQFNKNAKNMVTKLEYYKNRPQPEYFIPKILILQPKTITL